jgi:hypothetical protein
MDIVLGLAASLARIGSLTGGCDYRHWYEQGLSDVDASFVETPEDFTFVFEQAVDRAERIHFSLDGLDLRKAATDGAKPLRFETLEAGGNVTSWEFLQVLDNPKTLFYRGDREVPREQVVRELKASVGE